MEGFPIAVALAWGGYLIYFRDGLAKHGESLKWQTVIVALACAWVTVLLLEGFGLFGEYAGPEPHM